MKRPDLCIARGLALSAALTAGLAGCSSSPLAAQTERDLRRSVVEAAQKELRDSARQPLPVVTTRRDLVSQLGIKPEAMEELERMAGPQSDAGAPLPLGNDLLDQPVRTVQVSLRRAIASATQNNLAVQFARLSPAVAEQQVVAAEAAFDWTLFSNLNYSNINEPRT